MADEKTSATSSSTNQALFIHGAGDARVAPFQLRDGRPGEVLVEVAAVGICGSDLHYYKDGGIGAAVISQPFVPGHEFGGRLTEDLEEKGLARGALVAVDPSHACGRCPQCRAGHANLCPTVEFTGAPPFHGGMTGRIWVRREQIVPLPEGFTPLRAAMLEPLGVALHAVDLARPRMGERVALIGCGGLGLQILQLLKLTGAAEVLAIEPQARRRELARQFGAARVAPSVAAIAEWTSGQGCSLVIEATNSPDGFRDAVRAATAGGRVVLVGIPDGDVYTLPAAEARRRGLTVRFSRRMGEVYPRTIALVASGRIDVDAVVSHAVGLDGAPAAFRAHAEGAPESIKTIIFPNGVPASPKAPRPVAART
jgi:L-iditol 2-dehydrogenase